MKQMQFKCLWSGSNNAARNEIIKIDIMQNNVYVNNLRKDNMN